jgi:hypothetical protein
MTLKSTWAEMTEKRKKHESDPASISDVTARGAEK